MNTYNLSQLNKINKVELNKMVQAKQAQLDSLTLKREHYNNQMDKLICRAMFTDIDFTFFEKLRSKVSFISANIGNIRTFKAIAKQVKPAVSLSKAGFVSLSKKPLPSVNLSQTKLERGI